MKKIFLILLLAVFLLCSCGKSEKPIDIKFEKQEGEYYLFDDNPEYLRPEYRADGEIPSSIACFDELGEGTYTVFSYHHRGTSAEIDEDLYFDFLFSSDDAVVEIENFCMDVNWQWHKAWADYSGTEVTRPIYYKNASCNCGGGGEKHKSGCPAVCGGDVFEPTKAEELGVPMKVSGNLLLSDMLGRIKDDGLNRFRNTSKVDPVWLMMKFKVVSGTVSAATVCYSDIGAASENFDTMKKGSFFNEVQYKGIADCAPAADTEISYAFSDYSGAIPVRVKNMRAPEGYVSENGRFATSINTWREEKPIAAESDMAELRYRDASKADLYGKNRSSDNVWHFDPFHTKLYGGESEEILEKYGAAVGADFEPNGAISDLKHPGKKGSKEFYKYFACNLGNFGFTYKFKLNLENSTDRDRVFRFNIDSDAPEVYRFTQKDGDGNIIYSDGGKYITKKFDDEPKGENPEFMSDDIKFSVPKNSTSTAEVEVVILTGCNAPVYYTFYSE